MNGKFELATTRDFNGIKLNCYVEDGQDNSGDFWATREQIGQLLGYSHPTIAIGKIHRRNKERLDKFSRVNHIGLSSGGTQTATVYNFKGLLEICRFSNQPNANAIIDFLWDVADEIRRTGMYITTKKLRQLEERIAVLEQQAQADYPVKLLGSIVLARPESITFQSAAHFLAQHGIKVGQNRLYKKCRDTRLLCRRKGKQWNKPSQQAVERGLFELMVHDGFRPITMVTPKGLQLLAEMFESEDYPLFMLMDAEEGETE